MLVTVVESVMLVNPVHSLNASLPMLVTLLGIVMPVIVVLPLKAPTPMATTGRPPIVDGTTTAPPAAVYPVMVIVLLLVENSNPVTAATFTVTCTGLAEANAPSKAFTVKAFRALPLFAGIQTRDSFAERSVVPASTATPFLVNVPVLTASTRKEIGSESASNASAAAAKAAYVMV